MLCADQRARTAGGGVVNLTDPLCVCVCVYVSPGPRVERPRGGGVGGLDAELAVHNIFLLTVLKVSDFKHMIALMLYSLVHLPYIIR